MFADMLFIYAEHIGGRRSVGLHVIVELIAVYVAKVASFANPQDHRLEEGIEAPQHRLGRHLRGFFPARGIPICLSRIVAHSAAEPFPQESVLTHTRPIVVGYLLKTDLAVLHGSERSLGAAKVGD